MSYGFNTDPATVYYRPRRDTIPTSFEECERLEASKRKNWTGKLANNTYLDTIVERPSGRRGYLIVLHRTAVVTFWADGSIRLDTGGWQTLTTRDRIDRCGVKMWTEKGKPFIRWGDEQWRRSGTPWDSGATWHYEDEMTLYPDGSATYKTCPHRPWMTAAELRRELAQ
jgi:hypothetical protein